MDSRPRLPDLTIGIQKTAVCRKNGIRRKKLHNEFYYSVRVLPLPAPRIRPVEALNTKLMQTHTHISGGAMFGQYAICTTTQLSFEYTG